MTAGTLRGCQTFGTMSAKGLTRGMAVLLQRHHDACHALAELGSMVPMWESRLSMAWYRMNT